MLNSRINLMHLVQKSLLKYLFFFQGDGNPERGQAAEHCSAAAPAPARFLGQERWQILTKSSITSIFGFPPKGSLRKAAGMCAPCCSTPSLGKRFVVRAVPVGRCSHRHPSKLLGTAISRQIWRFRPRKHKRFLPAGMHPTPMKEITTLPAGLEEGLRFSPSAAVCWLARCLQLKSFFFVVVVVLNCSAWLQKEAFEGMAGEPSCPTCSNF